MVSFRKSLSSIAIFREIDRIFSEVSRDYRGASNGPSVGAGVSVDRHQNLSHHAPQILRFVAAPISRPSEICARRSGLRVADKVPDLGHISDIITEVELRLICSSINSVKEVLHCPACLIDLAPDSDYCPRCGQEFCPSCSSPIKTEATYCKICGVEFTVHCPECSAEIDVADISCPRCGVLFDDASAADDPEADASAADDPESGASTADDSSAGASGADRSAVDAAAVLEGLSLESSSNAVEHDHAELPETVKSVESEILRCQVCQSVIYLEDGFCRGCGQIICVWCGSAIDEEDEVCPSCERELYMDCPICHFELIAGTEICPNCDALFPKFCTFCGIPIDPGTSQCPSCQRSLTFKQRRSARTLNRFVINSQDVDVQEIRLLACPDCGKNFSSVQGHCPHCNLRLCPTCQIVFEKDEMGCPRCGIPVASGERSELTCPNCRQTIKTGEVRCSNCDQLFCPSCLAAIGETDSSCPKCGTQFELSCPECGGIVGAQDLVCPHCAVAFDN